MAERFNPRQGNIFNKYDISDLTRQIESNVIQKIKSLDEEYILNVDEISYKTYLQEEYRIECPDFFFEDKWLEKRTVLVSTQYLPHFHYYYETEVEKKVFRLHIPFAGDYHLLWFHPNSWNTGGWSHFTIGQNYVYIDILDVNENATTIKRDIDSYCSALQSMVSNLGKDIHEINEHIRTYISQVFSARKQQIIKEQKEIAEIGIPLQNSSSKNTYTVPKIRLRYQEPAVSKQKTMPDPASPMLSSTECNKIIRSLFNIGQSYERCPESVNSLDEEKIRWHFLTHLNTAFESLSNTGEAFSHNGKTDIMVKDGNTVLFIAECKIWHGAKKLTEAIDQLLSYLTWRDNTATLIIFNKSISMSLMIETIKDTVKGHTRFIEEKNQTNEGWLNYTFSLNENEDKHLNLSILCFNFK